MAARLSSVILLGMISFSLYPAELGNLSEPRGNSVLHYEDILQGFSSEEKNEELYFLIKVRYITCCFQKGMKPTKECRAHQHASLPCPKRKLHADSVGERMQGRWWRPLIAADIAKAMPVFPLVASMRVSPGLICPAFSASWIMLIAGLQVKSNWTIEFCKAAATYQVRAKPLWCFCLHCVQETIQP